MRKNYPTDLSDSQWAIIQRFLEDRADRRGRPSKREIINAIFYILRGGCAWRLLPHDFPPWKTVYNHFYDWQNLGLWEKINEQLVQQYRLQKGRKQSPTAAR